MFEKHIEPVILLLKLKVDLELKAAQECKLSCAEFLIIRTLASLDSHKDLDLSSVWKIKRHTKEKNTIAQ